MLADTGLDMVLLNMFHQPAIETAKLCDMLLGDKAVAWGKLTSPKKI